jgi:cholesterol transport system auxiliary component
MMMDLCDERGAAAPVPAWRRCLQTSLCFIRGGRAAARSFTSLALLLAVAACAAPPAPRETFYRLDNAAAPAPFAHPLLPGILQVDRVETEGVLSERAIAYQSGPGALQRYTYDFWTEAPSLLMQDQLARALQSARVAGTVVTPDLRVAPDWILRTKLLRFEQVPAENKVTVQLRAAVIGARNGRLALQQDYTATAPTTSNTAEAAAHAMGVAVADVLAHLVADMGNHPQAAEAP